MNEPNPSLGIARALWDDLVRGCLKVLPQGPHDHFLRLAPADPRAWTPGRERRHAACAAVLRGQSQKVVAAELGLTPATLAGLVSAALLELGVDVRCARVPLALPLLLHAAEGSRVVSFCEVGEGGRGDWGGPPWQLSLGLPEQVLASELSPGEQEVTRAYLSGQSYAEIAGARGSSTRTVANQLGQSFRKLGASGRFSLIAAVLENGARRGAPLTLTLRSAPAADEDVAPLSATTFPRSALSA